MLNIALFGPPGAGKGTQSEYLVKHFNLFYISTGDLLRREIAAGSKLGEQARSIIASGGLVSDEIIVQIIEKTITDNPDSNGFLFDGFPRTIAQAEAMKAAGVKIDAVLEIDVPDEAIVERMSGRRAHLASGRTYHVTFNPPKVAGIDDVTGEPLVQRADDDAATVKKRLAVYHAQTRPLVDYYLAWAASGDAAAPRYCKVDGTGSVDDIAARALQALR
jgi:adenylate kinase